MNRTIKFRAWDDDVKHMFYSEKAFENDYFFEFKNGELRGFAIRPPRPSADPMEPPEPYCDDYDVMQYTGLKDKKGVEIYEGDIVQFDVVRSIWDEEKHEVIEHRPETWKRVVEYKAPKFIIHWYPNKIEVIGNVHSTPELLKE